MIRVGVLSRVQRPAAAGILVGVFVLALANRLLPVLRGGGLSSVLGYDDAVYYAGTVGLVHGQMPYRDFLLLHPPGILLALAPAAAVGRWVGEVAGWEVSRVAWMLLAVAPACWSPGPCFGSGSWRPSLVAACTRCSRARFWSSAPPCWRG